MTRRVLVFLSLVALAACSKEPSAPSDQSGGPTFVISDAGHSGGRPDFGWRPPIANTTLLGTFDGNRHPNVRICVLNATADGCTGADVFTATDVPVILSNYQVDWTVPISPVGKYRIFVETVSPSVILGYADVQTAANSKGLKGVDPNQYVPITDGSILPIKFRINTACATANCGGGFIDTRTGGTSYYTENGTTVGGVTIGPQTESNLVTVNITRCTSDLPIDNPKFGSCLNVFAQDEDGEIVGANALVIPGAVFVCDAPAAVSALSPAQQDLVTLHRKHGSDPVQALPHAPDQCPVVVLSSSVKGLLRALVRGNWKKAGQQLAGLFAPQPLYARRLDAGAGGQAGEFSLFQFALPATIEIYAGHNQIAQAGSLLPVDPTVAVKDLLGNPVENATVHFSAIDGSVAPLTRLTDALGHASADWTLAAPGNLGQNHLLAYGVGLAGDNANGPRTGTDPFIPLNTNPPFNDASNGGAVTLDTGRVTFAATPVDGFETAAGWTATGFWHRSTLAGITNQAFIDSLVRLAPGDLSVGAMPSPFAGTYSYWYGTETGLGIGSEDGNYIGTRSGNNAFESFSGGESTAFNNGTLTSAPFIVPADGVLRFESWFEIESFDADRFDFMIIRVLEVGGPTTLLGILNPAVDPDGEPWQPFTTGGFNAPPVWAGFSQSLSAFAGQNVQLQFEFHTSDHQYNGFRGWLLDNVRVVPEPIIITLKASSILTSGGSRTLNAPRPFGTRKP